MFNSVSEILKNFTAAQRITALLILVFTIVLVTLGPSIIDSNTNTCDELTVRLKSQSDQLIAQDAQIQNLTSRINRLNSDLLVGQAECTENLIRKQQEIMALVDGMIDECKRSPMRGAQRWPASHRPVEIGMDTVAAMFMRLEVEPDPLPDETLSQLRRLKTQIQKKIREK